MLRDGESRKVSVIVPAYNAERFVKRCVESLLCQTYQNMEVILVDDGSADHTGEIFDGYYKRYRSLIKVEHSVHGGVSNARLLGLKKAAGAYIAFVDADDWVEPEFISSMASHMSEADIVAAGISQETEEQKKVICEYNGLLSGRYASDWERAALTKTRIAPVTDHMGDNISEKNKKYCELTALYWIWKHDRAKYVGLSHYRRRFALSDQAVMRLPETGNFYYGYNMLIARREIFDQYCEWLFPILSQCERCIGDREDVYQGRYIGFLAERLMTIFLTHHKKEFKSVIARKHFIESE